MRPVTRHAQVQRHARTFRGTVMKTIETGAASAVALALTLAGCATSPAPGSSAEVFRASDAPEALRPPANQTLVLAARATGVQIYECSANAAGRYEWTLK